MTAASIPDFTPAIIAALEPYGYNHRTGRSRSPLRSWSDSLSFHYTPDPAYAGGGKWSDFAAGGDDGASGNALELVKALGLVSDSKIDATPAQVIVCLADYAAAHGVTEEVFASAGWRDTVYMGHAALSFKTRTGTRYRILAPEGVKTLGKYRSPKDYERCWYGFERALAKVVEVGQPLVVCNGEASVLVAASYGVPAACQTGGEHDLSAANLAELVAGKDDVHSGYPLDLPLLVALDCDATGRKAALGLVAQMREAGFTDVRAVDLRGGKGFDLADFCRLHGADSVAALQALPDVPESQASLPVSSDPDLLVKQAKRITELEAQVQAQADQIQWMLAMLRNKAIPTGQRITAIAAYAEVQGQRSKLSVAEGEAVPVRIGVIADESGQSASTVSSHIQRLERAGVWERTLVSSRTDDGEIRKELRLTPAPVLARPLQIEAEPDAPRHGGDRTHCVDCGSDDLVRITRIVCKACGCAQGEPLETPVNPDPVVERLPEPETSAYRDLFTVDEQELSTLFDPDMEDTHAPMQDLSTPQFVGVVGAGADAAGRGDGADDWRDERDDQWAVLDACAVQDPGRQGFPGESRRAY